MFEFTGSCLCGGVVCHIELRDETLSVCHCGMCRKQGAGPMHYTLGVAKEKLEITKGEELLTTYHSSEKADRAFCSRCGTPIYWYLYEENPDNDIYSANASLFPKLTEEGRIAMEFFYDIKPAYYDYHLERSIKLDSDFDEIVEEEDY